MLTLYYTRKRTLCQAFFWNFLKRSAFCQDLHFGNTNHVAAAEGNGNRLHLGCVRQLQNGCRAGINLLGALDVGVSQHIDVIDALKTVDLDTGD